MRHDWIFDVLTDLKDYALAHGMVALAAKADEALLVARQDVAWAETLPDATDGKTPKPNTH